MPAAWNFSTMSRGVFAGMNTPNQIALSAFCRPASAGVGTSGRSATRFGVDTTQRAHLAGLDQRKCCRERTEIEIDPAADDVGDHLGAAAIGHVGRLDAGGEAEFLGADMHRAADADRAERDRSGLCLGVRDEVLHGLPRPRRPARSSHWRWSRSSAPRRGPWSRRTSDSGKIAGAIVSADEWARML